MTHEEVLRELEALGTEQNRQIYRRHGMSGPLFGVSHANLGALKKKIKLNHRMALGLWASGNHDARVLATMVADPEQADRSLLDAWAQDLDNSTQADAFAKYAAHTALARQGLDGWIRSPEEWTAAAGWNVLALLALEQPELLDTYFEPYLEAIERDIASAKNRVRYSMNGALIAIGSRGGRLRDKALGAAERIGPVEVDHGETGLKTPAAAEMIAKAAGRGNPARKGS